MALVKFRIVLISEWKVGGIIPDLVLGEQVVANLDRSRAKLTESDALDLTPRRAELLIPPLSDWCLLIAQRVGAG